MPTPILRLVLTLLLLAAPLGWLLEPGTPRSAAQPSAPIMKFKVPAGFVVERVAGPPLVQHPMMACFDERGRLFIAEAAGVNRKAADLLANPPNAIRLLEAADDRGIFRAVRTFADKMTLPMGVLWHDGALYTASPPSLWRLEDTRGTGVADQRQELVTRFGFTGNAADVHGPFLGPDGRLYWCDGRHGHEIKRPDGTMMRGKAARIFRCRPDGSEVEVVCGGGMDNPVEIAFTAEGEPLVTVNILHNRPARNDGIIYAIEGGVYPWHDVLKEFKRTGDLLPAVADLGWVAPSGLVRYRGAAFGAGYQGNLFSAQFNRRRVQRHIVERDGAAFRVRTEDFLVADDPNFHPTDVLEDADGSLLVVDTGGWFRIGCPTSKIAQPEIKGAIYRVRRADAPRIDDPRGLKLAWETLTPAALAGLLDDTRFAVRDQAIALLAKRGAAALPALEQVLKGSKSARACRNAVWTLTRIDLPAARALVRQMLSDKELTVRLAAAHSAGLHRDQKAVRQLTTLVGDGEPAVRRQAATALGRLGAAEAVPALLEALKGSSDRFLEHALIYALIEIGDRTRVLKGLSNASPAVRRGALIALDQMEGGGLTREQVLPQLNTDDPALQRTALGIVSTRPGWASEIVGLLRQWLAEPAPDAIRQEALRGVLLALCKEPAVQELTARGLNDAKTSAVVRLLLLETVARAPIEKLPPAWVSAAGKALGDEDERVVRQAIAAVRAARVADFDARLLKLASDARRSEEVRVAAIAAAAPRLSPLPESALSLLLKQLGKDTPPLLRLAAAEALASARLDERSLERLTEAVAAAGPLELPGLLAAYERPAGAAIGKRLLAALAKAPGLPNLTPEALQRVLRGYPPEVQSAAAPLLKRLASDSEQQRQRLAELEPTLNGGNAERGRQVFLDHRATCAACHSVEGRGGRIGPDLSKIGSVRNRRDLLEAIVFPSASFARGYEPYTVALRDGRVFVGILGRETAEAVYLITAERAEVRLPRPEVESIVPGRVSIMPQGLDTLLSRQELADLIAFLEALR
ncbi:MAG TPA: PVC-type heme-binding CxxCH protein [Gemmataceae bacterium]|nr:PVC-type heme-binding CxxCH protein [Gemmataceae bacterium]